MTRFRVEFKAGTGRNLNPMPRRVFYIAAEDEREVFEHAKAIEAILEWPSIYRDRTLKCAIVEELTREDDE